MSNQSNENDENDENDENLNYDNYSTRTFEEDYPNSSRILARYKSGNYIFVSWYNVLSLGYYPANIIITQKNSKDGKRYWIPDNYIIETELGNKKLRCETKYISDQKVKYAIFWKESDAAEWSIYNEKSATGTVIAISRKRPISTIKSKSGQNKRFAAFSKDAEQKLLPLIKKHQLTNITEQPVISIKNIELDFNGEIINLIYNKNIEPAKLDSVVRACDESLLSRDGYRRLAAIESHLICEYCIGEQRNNITNNINKKIRIGTFNLNETNLIDDELDIQPDEGILVEKTDIGTGVYRSISTILETLISIWKNGKNGSSPILKQGDTIKLKIGGDGRNVGRKQSHVMMTFCLLNEKEKVLKPNHQYCICLYIGHENYNDLMKIGKLFQHQLSDLQDNGIIIDKDNVHWNIELFFSGDWKFIYIIMGLNAPNSKFFCLYCNCSSELRWNMDINFENTGNTACKNRKPAIFPAIKQENYIPDELHLLLRISDILLECFFSDLMKKKEFSKQIKPAIELAFQNIKIHFEFFQSKSTGKQWNWTSLMGPDKKKMLEKFPVSQFVYGICGKDIEYLWREFYHAQNWVQLFCRPTQGSTNNSNQIQGLYQKEDITPYMHVFAKHISQFLQQLKEKDLSLKFFSTSSIEKKNHNQVRLFFGGTTMGGGTDEKSVVYNIMSFEN
ncbi:hypothetical protein Glove_294g123 [Diversispora epigaea]|uniref:Uncharacterized protein n=1 Tax=Diversispora epigaea TaxID=1348612 RepID=A0A397HZ88_9GLOM|nr:hypothetical protein Glove_294g123 [Diversispora epigaea]